MMFIKETAHNKIKNTTPSLILKAAQKGDLFAISIISKIGFDLVKGIGSLVQILNSETVILSGSLAKAGPYMSAYIEQAIQQHTFGISIEGIELIISERGNTSGGAGQCYKCNGEFI